MTNENLVMVKISKEGYILKLENISDKYRYKPLPLEEDGEYYPVLSR